MKPSKPGQDKIKAVSYEIRAIIEDYRSEIVGGALCELELWKICALPSLLSSSSTWMEVKPEAVEIAEQLQLNFLRLLFKVPKSCPRSALRSESGLLSIKYQIVIAKLSLLFHIRNMEEETLAKQVYNHQLLYGWPGLVREGIKLCEELGIPDVTKVKASDKEFKWMIKKACMLKDQEELKLDMSSKEKLHLLKEEDCKQKPYISEMSLPDVRILFRHKTRMTKSAENYKKLPKYTGEGAKCKFCLQYDSHSHIMRCEAFLHLRSPEVCLDNDVHLVKYIRQVLHLREDKEEQEQKEKKEQEGAGRSRKEKEGAGRNHDAK